MSQLTIALLFAVLPFVPALAKAHGEAEWIRQDQNYGWCCGPQDCERAPPGAVVLRGDVYIIPSTSQSFRDRGRAEDGLFPSIDMDYWWCRYPDGRVRCLFVPPMSW